MYSRDKKYYATVMADGTLKNGSYCGSIHSVSAKMLGKQSYNGWSFGIEKHTMAWLVLINPEQNTVASLK